MLLGYFENYFKIIISFLLIEILGNISNKQIKTEIMQIDKTRDKTIKKNIK